MLDVFRGRRPRGPVAASSSPAAESPPKPDFTPFERENFRGNFRGLSLPHIVALASTCLGQISEATRPEHVPWHILDTMAFDPYVDLGEMIWAAPLQDASLYRIEHDDPAIVAEHNAWFNKRRIKPQLLRVITTAFGYGVIPYLFDWTVRDLSIKVPKEDGSGLRNKNLVGHQHYFTVSDLHPGDLDKVTVRGDELESFVWGGDKLLAETGRPFMSVWGMRFGNWAGKASRRKAYNAWYRGTGVGLWQGRYLERSVDPPRVGYAPPGKVEINGKVFNAARLLTSAVMSLKNGGTAILPGSFQGESTERAWDIDTMDLPDRSNVWHDALDACSVEKLVASMVPPSAAGIKDAAFASGRVHLELFQELLNVASNWIAEELEGPIECVHRLKYGDTIPPPTVKAREFPRAKAKRLLDIFKAVQGAQRSVQNGDKEVTLAERVDADILEELGVKMRPLEDAARDKRGPPPGQPGRPIESTGQREERRENAREPEGEGAVGAEGEQVDA